jgi:hypothetical protein
VLVAVAVDVGEIVAVCVTVGVSDAAAVGVSVGSGGVLVRVATGVVVSVAGARGVTLAEVTAV